MPIPDDVFATEFETNFVKFLDRKEGSLTPPIWGDWDNIHVSAMPLAAYELQADLYTVFFDDHTQTDPYEFRRTALKLARQFNRYRTYYEGFEILKRFALIEDLIPYYTKDPITNLKSALNLDINPPLKYVSHVDYLHWIRDNSVKNIPYWLSLGSVAFVNDAINDFYVGGGIIPYALYTDFM